MRLILAILLLLPFGLNAATTFTEFYVKPTGNVMNGGSDTNDAPKCFLTGGFWTNSPAVFRKDASTFTNVAVGDFASVYPDGTGTNVFTALVTNVTSTNIWLSLVAKTGTSPANDTAGATSIRVGGAWAGPNTNSASLTNTIFPFNFVAATMTNAPNLIPRVNFYAATYSVTNSMTHAGAGPVVFQGMTSLPGDLGKATFFGGSVGTSFILLAHNGASVDFADFIFSNNGNTGSASGVECGGTGRSWFRRCVFANMMGYGLNLGVYGAEECEAYGCNISGTSLFSGFAVLSSSGMLVNCYSHDNTGSGSCGFRIGATASLIRCIASSNNRAGAYFGVVGNYLVDSCDFYNNAGAGIEVVMTTIPNLTVRNSNFIKNTGFAVTNSTASRVGVLYNCGFGSGTMANGGAVHVANIGGINEIGSIDYAANSTPWTDPANGDFRINLTAAKSAGRGLFTQSTVNSPTNTVSFPDIGAAQSASTNAAAAGGTTAHTFAQ